MRVKHPRLMNITVSHSHTGHVIDGSVWADAAVTVKYLHGAIHFRTGFHRIHNTIWTCSHKDS